MPLVVFCAQAFPLGEIYIHVPGTVYLHQVPTANFQPVRNTD
jgi:hypothetical protein